MSDNDDYTPEGFTRDKDGNLIPHFKPGKSITTWFGREHLNGHIYWPGMMREVLEYSQKARRLLANELDVKPSAIENMLHGDTTGFTFHQGAHLRAMHTALLRGKGYPVIDE